jgi:fibronectin type 3 domain-containing protein
MFEHRPDLIASRGFMVAVCLALLVGCGAGVNTKGTDTSGAAGATIGVPTAPPMAPASLTVTPGNAQASLTWSASSGATSYHVKRATASGGPYSQVGAPTSASYTDTSLTNGTMYYYVVSALDSAGESANSSQVSATPNVISASTWHDVTPANIDLSSADFGAVSMQVDTANPAHIYASFSSLGVWKSTDYGATWTGPVNNLNTQPNGLTITLSPTGAGNVPILYGSSIDPSTGGGPGFFKSTDDGVTWTQHNIAPLPSNRQDVYAPVIDPYNPNHLLMAGHEQDYVVQSVDGGKNWTNVALNSGMLQGAGTAYIFFINTGSASTTANTWLWLAQGSGGGFGTWRTTNGGTTWTKVDNNEHPHGACQIYQPDTGGVVFMAGIYSAGGWGVLRSTDYGQTWTHVGASTGETVVVGTPNNVYAMYGWAAGTGNIVPPAFELAAQPGTGTWTSPATPESLTQGPAQIIVTNDGAHNILVGAMWSSGVWRYIEP